MHRAALVSVLCVLLAGCGGSGVAFAPVTPGGPNSEQGETNIRAVIPALEAYFADNGTYGGVTLEKLRSTYDPALIGVRFVVANVQTYCVESTMPGERWSKPGPATEIVPGRC